MIKTFVKELKYIECDNLSEVQQVLPTEWSFRIFAEDAENKCELYDTQMIVKTLGDFFTACEDNLSPYTTTYTIYLWNTNQNQVAATR